MTIDGQVTQKLLINSIRCNNLANNVAKEGVAVLALILVAGVSEQALAGEFTLLECKTIAIVATKVVKAVGKDTLSVEFRQSFRDWLGAPLTCKSPATIRAPTGADIDAYNTIRTVLGSGDHPIDLLERGVSAHK